MLGGEAHAFGTRNHYSRNRKNMVPEAVEMVPLLVVPLSETGAETGLQPEPPR